MNLFMKATASLALGAATLTVFATPAEAQRYRYDRYRDRDRGGDVIAAGVVGLAIGEALASNGRRDRYYDRSYYYDRGYYDGPRYRDQYYSYDRPYRGYYRQHCRTRRVYDPYLGRRVRVRYCR